MRQEVSKCGYKIAKSFITVSSEGVNMLASGGLICTQTPIIKFPSMAES